MIKNMIPKTIFVILALAISLLVPVQSINWDGGGGVQSEIDPIFTVSNVSIWAGIDSAATSGDTDTNCSASDSCSSIAYLNSNNSFVGNNTFTGTSVFFGAPNRATLSIEKKAINIITRASGQGFYVNFRGGTPMLNVSSVSHTVGGAAVESQSWWITTNLHKPSTHGLFGIAGSDEADLLIGGRLEVDNASYFDGGIFGDGTGLTGLLNSSNNQNAIWQNISGIATWSGGINITNNGASRFSVNDEGHLFLDAILDTSSALITANSNAGTIDLFDFTINSNSRARLIKDGAGSVGWITSGGSDYYILPGAQFGVGTATPTEDFQLKLSDGAGANKFSIINSSDVEMMSVDSAGNLNATGNITADIYFGDGSQLTGIESGGGIWENVSNVATYRNDINTTGDVFFGKNVSHQIIAQHGRRLEPVYTFTGATDTGMFYDSAFGDVCLVENGNSQHLCVSTNQLKLSFTGSKAQAGLILNEDSNTGLYQPSGDQLGITIGGVDFIWMQESTTDWIEFNRGSDNIDFIIQTSGATPMFYIDGEGNYLNISGGYDSTGVTIYNDGNTSIAGELIVDGNVNIGTTNITGNLDVYGNITLNKIVMDKSGNSNHGTNNGAIPVVSEIKTDTPIGEDSLVGYWDFNSIQMSNDEGALEFDGADDYVEITANNNLRPDKITVEAWIKLNELGSTIHTIAEQTNKEGNGTWLGYDTRTTNAFWWNCGTTGSSWTGGQGTYQLSENTWYNIVAVCNGTSKEVYVDGKLAAWEVGTSAVDWTGQENVDLDIGRSIDVYGTNFKFNGTIDEVKIWNRALSPDEILALSQKNYQLEQTVGNLTILNRITFKFGEFIDNLVDGWLRITGNLNVTGNVTADNVFIPQYMYAHTNATIPVAGASVWTNITFSQEDADLKRGISHTYNDATNHTFTLMDAGIYNVDYDLDIEDTSVGASDVDVAARLVRMNGSEVLGSVFETDITKQGTEVELSHNFLIYAEAGDKFIVQFIATDEDVVISTHGTFGIHPESSSLIINKIANLP